MSRLESKSRIPTIVVVILMMMMIDSSYAANGKTKDDTFNINITMLKFNTTQVRLIEDFPMDFIYFL